MRQKHVPQSHKHESRNLEKLLRKRSEEAVTVLDHSIIPESHEGESRISSIYLSEEALPR